MGSTVLSRNALRVCGMNLAAERQALIGGEWLTAGSATSAAGEYEVENPASGVVIARLVKCGKEETNRAIAAASEAFKTWSRRPAKDRAAVLMRWHDECVAARDDITRIMTSECGKPLAEARNEFDSGVESLRFFAAEATRALGDYIPGDDSRDFVVIKQPVGVVGAISPWYVSRQARRLAWPTLDDPRRHGTIREAFYSLPTTQLRSGTLNHTNAGIFRSQCPQGRWPQLSRRVARSCSNRASSPR